MLAVAYRDSVSIAPEIIEGQINSKFEVCCKDWTDQEYVRAFGKTKDDLVKELYPVIEEQLLVQKMESQLIGSIQVTPQEVKDYFKDTPPNQMPQLEAEVEVAQILILPSQNTSP